ncbi:TniB family NTP-binding protein [Bradyrhizobium sp. Arg816]|uniref:TniB family NTP-binding protein n=1 Tax=Bradyrhizobium sp. Arg816 TaxID=2998491 RepID=UPI0034D61098
MPASPDERRFFGAILEELGMGEWPGGTIAAQQRLAVRLMRKADVRMLVIDELHNVLSGSRTRQCVLVSNCPSCSRDLWAHWLGSQKPRVVGHCDHCDFRLSKAIARPALRAAAGLQGRLLKLKRTGAEMPPLGWIDWSTFPAIADLGMYAIWVDTADHARETVFSRIVRDLGMKPDQRLFIEWPANYGSLVMMTCMLADWPNRLQQTLHDLQSLNIDGIL